MPAKTLRERLRLGGFNGIAMAGSYAPKVVLVMARGIKFLWLLLGLSAVALGVLGIFLPFLPTTPFMILAAWAFARSSERLHHWLITHRIFGQIIRDWQAHRAIPPRAKKMALVMMAAAFLLSVAMGVKPWILVMQALLLLCLGTWLATRPNPPHS